MTVIWVRLPVVSLIDITAHSSTGQSIGFLLRGLQIRILLGGPNLIVSRVEYEDNYTNRYIRWI